jgi:hypothetical protein
VRRRVGVLDRLVSNLKARTVWTAAWVEGGGETIDAAGIQPQPESALEKLYNTDSFAPSVWLKDWNTLPHL